jgi:integrase
MARDKVSKLVDSEIKNAKPKAKPYPLNDGDGLVLLVQPSGAKWWRYRYRFDDKSKMISLGTYPDVTLAKARKAWADAYDKLQAGIDPSAKRQEDKQPEIEDLSTTFEVIARQWWERWKAARTPRHADYVITRLAADVFPMIGTVPVDNLTAPMILQVVRKIESRGATDIAKRALSTIGQVLRWSVANGLSTQNAAASIKPSEVLAATTVTNLARIDAKELPELLRKIEGYDGQALTKLALKLVALTFVRTSELIGARWAEFELEESRWRIPAERMKMKTPHIVPLSTQALEVLGEIHAISGGGEILFPSERGQGKSMSNNTILFALYRLGYHSRMTGHGFRGLASTILHEQGWPHAHIELQLAHSARDAVSAAYNHALYLEPRAKMMQHWGDFLDRQRQGAKVIKLKASPS